MNEAISVTEGMFRLLHAIRDDEFIRLTPRIFLSKVAKEAL